MGICIDINDVKLSLMTSNINNILIITITSHGPKNDTSSKFLRVVHYKKNFHNLCPNNLTAKAFQNCVT